MINAVMPWLLVFLMLNLAAGLWRAWQGPTDGDRLLSALLFGTTSIALLLMIAEWLALPTLRSVALLLVMFASILSLAFFGMPEHGDD